MGDPFRPTWQRGLLAAAVATAAFLLPQEAPLEWYPLNDPSSGLQYLEITCAANITGTTRIKYDIGSGFDPLHTITIPIAPSQQAFTYTFPLPDAPLRGLRLEPLDGTGELRITNFRIIDRAETEIRRFTMDSFQPEEGIATIDPTNNGWMIRCAPNGQLPAVSITMGGPVIPRGMNDRNLQRCLLSWSYLSGMLWLLLLIAWLVSLPPNRWKHAVHTAGFLALLGALFSAVGNRGLIKNSITAWRFPPTPMIEGLHLEIDLSISIPTEAEFFWDTGAGYNGVQSLRRSYAPHLGLQVVRCPLPQGNLLRGLRWDPSQVTAQIRIVGIRVIDRAGMTRLRLPFNAIHAEREIDTLNITPEQLEINTARGGRDPILEFTPSAVTAISRTLQPTD